MHFFMVSLENVLSYAQNLMGCHSAYHSFFLDKLGRLCLIRSYQYFEIVKLFVDASGVKGHDVWQCFDVICKISMEARNAKRFTQINHSDIAKECLIQTAD